MTKVSEFKIGQKAEIKHTITKSDIDKFAELTGDNNPLHVDVDFAEKTSFKKPVAHGMLGASFISTIIGTKLPGKGALWFSQTLNFLLPVREGDELKISAEVISINEKQEYLELKTEVENQKKQKVISGTSKVRLIQFSEKKEEDIISKPSPVTLILGATGDVGTELVGQLVEQGHHIVVHYLSNKDKAAKIVKTFNSANTKVVDIKADLSIAKDVQEMFDNISSNFGYLTGIVNCSTPGMDRLKYLDTDWGDFEKELNVQIRGMNNVIRSGLELLLKYKNSKIIGLTSLAIEQPSPHMITYITAKSALSGFLKALSIELAPMGINVNMVSPGLIDNSLNMDVPEKIKLLNASKTPIKRLITVKDVSSAISYLLSDGANGLSGETIRINGGQIML